MDTNDQNDDKHAKQDEPADFVALSSLVEGHKPAPAARPDVPPILAGSNPREVLERIADGDPLWMRGRCDARMRALALMMSLPRLEAKALAYVARRAPAFRGDKPLPEWLADQVEAAIRDVVTEDREDTADGDAYAFACEAWRTTPQIARRSIVAFNDLPSVARRAYWAMVIDGKSIAQGARDTSVDEAIFRARVKRAMTALLTQCDPGGVDPPDGGWA